MNEFQDIHNHNFMINTILISTLILKVLNALEEELIKKIKSRRVCMIWEFHKIEKAFLVGNLQKDLKMLKI